MRRERRQTGLLIPLLLAAAGMIALFPGCSTLQADRLVSSADQARFDELDALEEELTLLRLRAYDQGGRPDAVAQADLSALAGREDELAAAGSLNRQYTARLEALRGLTALVAGKSRQAEDRLKDALAAWELDETAAMLEALLIEDPQIRLSYLDQRLLATPESMRLKAESASALFDLGRYGEAVSAWDESLPSLSPAWSALYADRRDKAWALKDGASPLEADSIRQITAAPMPMAAMVDVTERETDLLVPALDGRSLTGKALYDYLRERSYLLDAEASDTALRRDAAYFLWHLLADKLSDPGLLTRYRLRFATGGSPIADLDVDDPWFDAALGCVQYEIMALPDGSRFFPLGPVSGLDFLGWLRALEDY